MKGLLRPVTEEEIQIFDRDGAVLLKNILGSEWVDMLAEGLEYANNHPDGTVSYTHLPSPRD